MVYNPKVEVMVECIPKGISKRTAMAHTFTHSFYLRAIDNLTIKLQKNFNHIFIVTQQFKQYKILPLTGD